MASCWYLEHVTTRQKIMLHNGNNVMGRRPRCNIILCSPFVGVTMEHANIIVQSERVSIKSLTSLKGVFINGERIQREIEVPVIEGSIINLGYEEVAKVVPGNRAIFTLKKMGLTSEVIILSSDDEKITKKKSSKKVTFSHLRKRLRSMIQLRSRVKKKESKI